MTLARRVKSFVGERIGITGDGTSGGSLYTSLFFACQAGGALRSAMEVVPLVLEAVRPTSVVDFGCGTGAWLSVFEQAGVKICGLDGPHVSLDTLLIDIDKFRAADLEERVQLDQQFDLALCLEVAEHLRPASADTLIESLTSAAPVVLFSAAIPFQGGTGHINEQWPDYWAEKFKMAGFCPVDPFRSRLWTNARVDPWYSQNLLLFAHTSIAGQFNSSIQSTTDTPLPLIHPEAYLQLADPDRYTVRHALRLLRRALRNAARRRLIGS